MKIKVYTADVCVLEDQGLFDRLYRFVSPERRAKTDRMRFDKDKRLSLGAGALLERMLAECGVTDFTFTTEQNRKPRLAGRNDIRFNLSHSGTKVMCTVSDEDIGCDVERITEINMEIARRFFFQEEYLALMQCSGEGERNDLFFRYWTLKESFMKATGLGFRLALDSFCILLSDGEISLRQSVDKRPYCFREYFLHDGYRYAVCRVGQQELPAEMIRCDFRDF